MTNPPPVLHDPLAMKLSNADDRVLLSSWLPPQAGVVPKVRFGQRWVNVLWALPLLLVLLVIGVTAAQALRQFPAVQSFLVRYPGIPQSIAVTTGFPIWLRLLHFLNLFFMAFIIRAGVQILADHPRLYWKRDCTPGTEWFRFQKAVPTGRIWTAKDDSVTIPSWLGIPGIRHSIGTENPIPEEMDYAEIAVRMSVMNEVQFLFASEPSKPLKPRFLDVVFLIEKDVRIKRHRACNY